MACKDGGKDTRKLEMCNEGRTVGSMDWRSQRAGNPWRDPGPGVRVGFFEVKVSEPVWMNHVRGAGTSHW